MSGPSEPFVTSTLQRYKKNLLNKTQMAIFFLPTNPWIIFAKLYFLLYCLYFKYYNVKNFNG